MTDFIIVVILLVIIGTAMMYIIKAKKSGVKCIGCPADGACSGKQTGQCNCGCHSDADE